MFIYGYSFSQGSTLSIVSENDPFVLFLNNINVSPMPNTVAVVDGMKIGRNHVRLAFSRKGVPELNTQIELANDDKVHQLAYKVIKDAKGKYILQFVGDNNMSIVGQDTDDAQLENISGSRNTTTKESSSNNNKLSTKETASGTAQTSEIKVTVNQNAVSMNMNIPEMDSSNSTGKTEKSNSNRVPAVSDGLMCSGPTVDAQTLLKFKYKLSSVNMEMYKAKDIKEFMNKQCMLSAQVADLVKIVQMNDYQYEVAQLGYLRTYDQANYGLIVEALMAEFNKEKLLNFISTNQASQSYVPVKEDKKSTVEPKQSTYSTTTNDFSYSCIPMEVNDFDEALEAVDEPIDEDNKLEVAKSVFDQECLSTNQVYKVVDLFIDEDRKLDFAKFAFSRTSDKDKYFRINKAFIDENRITELSRYVKNNR
ncbi:hypothetical protein SanaruYs_37040 [Chryseotalea sanaruensis]|uniref:DUF4476 domain-containing protein n=2 Tax=Chryseotalea sanaruensis TaxID=2482724 RepID=A0A401UF29_9BACT|nr:hypothetical protein SanaruYs_37040 [Chryseotalea sanaruensis]